MKSIRSLLVRAAVASATLFASVPAFAQFVGDVFFTAPSVSIARDGTGELVLAAFVGSTPFGAAQAEVRYDASKLELASVEPVPVGNVTPVLKSVAAAGVVKIVVANGQALDAPIGTVSLARLTFRPLGTVGERVPLTTKVVAALGANRTMLRAGTGYGGEVTIAAAGATPKDVGTPIAIQAGAGSELEQRALQLRPAGHQVTLQQTDAAGRVRAVTVQTTDGSQPRD